eukprot:8847895-Pyramimonas_sp.AAC.1
MRRRPGRSVLQILKARVNKWLPEVPDEALPRMLLRLQSVNKAVSPYFAVNQVRLACRGLCTSSRSRSAARHCLFGCRGTRDTDCLRHYSVSPRMRAMLEPWARDELPTHGHDWFSDFFFLTPRLSPEADIRCSSVCDEPTSCTMPGGFVQLCSQV